MLFNPIIYLVLAAIAWVLGFLNLNETNNWLSMTPCLFFAALFAYTLFRPVTDRPEKQIQAEPRFQRLAKSSAQPSGVSAQTADRRSLSRPPAGLEKLTVNKIRTYSTAPFHPGI